MRIPIPLAACALASACVVAVRAAPPVRVHVTFGSPSAVPLSVLSSAVVETAQIWASYGVDISRDEARSGGRAADVALSVFLDAHHEAGEGDTCLGDIRFGADGMPDASVTLYYRAMVRFAAGAADPWPVKLQNQILSRVMGRALAHEIGHFVLRSPHHSERGLMRSRLRASSLTDPSRKGFGLTAPERGRLQVVLNAQADAAATQTR